MSAFSPHFKEEGRYEISKVMLPKTSKFFSPELVVIKGALQKIYDQLNDTRVGLFPSIQVELVSDDTALKNQSKGGYDRRNRSKVSEESMLLTQKEREEMELNSPLHTVVYVKQHLTWLTSGALVWL